jgi:prepilin-type N-terminal cleavage/methylation domain-containing protein
MKKNNKGFSLVELIVVVLIMAIIATALTLAVTKYVAKSKKASDVNTKGELIAAAQTAVTDFIGNGGSFTKIGDITYDTKTATWTGTDDDTFKALFTDAAGSDKILAKVNSNNGFLVTITVSANDVFSYMCTYTDKTAITS